jgi:hypothetical protein
MILDFLTILAFLLAAYQTWLTRAALIPAQKSIDLAKKIYQLDMLPQAHFIIHVRHQLDKWRREITEGIKSIETAVSNKNADALRELSEQGSITPRGLINKQMYEISPKWLGYIWEAGAQHYFSYKSSIYYLGDNRYKDSGLGFAKEMLEKYRKTRDCLSDLINVIDDAVPQSFLESPASLSVRDFFY